MRVQLNEKEIITLNETQKRVIQNDIFSDIFHGDMVRRLEYIIHHPSNRHMEHNAHQITESLKNKGLSSVPLDKGQLAELYFTHFPIALSEKESQQHSVFVDGKKVFDISSTTKKLLKSSVAQNCCCIEWSEERMYFILYHKYERCFERLKKEWDQRLAAKGITTIPTDPDAYAELVFSQPDYKNRSQREADATN